MASRQIEQMILSRGRCVARSPGVLDAQVGEAVRQAGPIGAPAGDALAVTPLPGAMGLFQVRGHQARVLVLPTALYRGLADPFHIHRAMPPDFTQTDPLPTLLWEGGARPPRRLRDVQAVLQGDDSAVLLGATQALIDGGRVAFARPTPDAAVIEKIWSLLPDSDRAERTFASWVEGTPAGFDVAVARQTDAPRYGSYLLEDSAADYPEGRYELALQLAAETDDADAIDQLFARRSMSQSIRLALTLLALGVVGGLAVRFIPWHRLR